MGTMCKEAEESLNVGAVKDWLIEYRNNERDLDNQSERLERLVMKMNSVGTQNLSDMPRTPTRTHDRIGDYLARREELEENIAATIKRQTATRTRIEELLSALKNPDEKAVIRGRYLDCLSWSDVSDLMFGGKPDFIGKEDSYLRRTHKIHGNALYHIAKLVAENDV